MIHCLCISELLLGLILSYHNFYSKEVCKKKKENAGFLKHRVPFLIEAADFQATGCQEAS